MIPKDCPVSVRPSLVECQMYSTKDRAFFPASPPWSWPGRGGLAAAYAEFNIPPHMASLSTNQREIDHQYRIMSAYIADDLPNGAATRLPGAAWAPHFAKFGYTVRPPRGREMTYGEVVQYEFPQQIRGWTPSPDVARLTVKAECDHCKRAIRLVQPPECICGEFFCSIKCHMDAWKDHKSICAQVVENSELASFVTFQQWSRLDSVELAAALPNSDVDHAALGLEKTYGRNATPTRAQMLEKAVVEVRYYDDIEKSHDVRDRFVELQRLVRHHYNGEDGTLSPEGKALNDIFCEEVVTVARRYGVALPTDTLARLLFKLTVVAQTVAALSSADPRLSSLCSRAQSDLKAALQQRFPELPPEIRHRYSDPFGGVVKKDEAMDAKTVDVSSIFHDLGTGEKPAPEEVE